MQISQNLKLRQSQSLIMTPQLQQAIKLLQLNNIELCELVRKEMEENPFLEDESEKSFVQNEQINESSTENVSEAFESGESILNEPKSEDVENRWDLDINVSPSNHNFDTTDSGSIAEQTVSEKITLKSFLNEQVKLEFKNLNERIIDNKFVNFKFFEEDFEVNIFFDYNTLDLIGWQTTDIYQNLSITFLDSVKRNQNLNNNLFVLPKQN